MEQSRSERVVDANHLLQCHQLVPVLHCLLFATADERVDGSQGEAGGVVALRVNSHMHIRDTQVIVVFVLTVHIDNLTQDAHRATHVVGYLRLALHRHADDDVSTHLPSDVRRIVVLQSTIHQHHVADTHRRESSGNGHRSTHGHRQTTAVEIILRIVNHVRRHAGKRDGQVAREVERVRVAITELLEQLCQVLTLDDAAVVVVQFTDGDAAREEVGVLLLAVRETLLLQVLFVRDHVAPVLHTHHRVERLCVVADGIETADDTSHRRTRDDVDRDACAFNHPQCTDMCHAFRTATAEYHSHFLSLDSHAVVLSHRHTTHQQCSQYQ